VQERKEVTWKHFLGSGFSEWPELAGSNREVGRKPTTQDSHVPMAFLTGTMCSTTTLAAADGSSDFALRSQYSHREVVFFCVVVSLAVFR